MSDYPKRQVWREYAKTIMPPLCTDPPANMPLEELTGLIAAYADEMVRLESERFDAPDKGANKEEEGRR